MIENPLHVSWGQAVSLLVDVPLRRLGQARYVFGVFRGGFEIIMANAPPLSSARLGHLCPLIPATGGELAAARPERSRA